MGALKPYTTANTLYCLYKDKRRKPTDFFNNFNLELKSVKNNGNCSAKVLIQHPRSGSLGGQPTSNPLGKKGISLCERYRIPQKLLDDIFTQIKKGK